MVHAAMCLLFALALLGSTNAQIGFGGMGVWQGKLEFNAFINTGGGCTGTSNAQMKFLHMVRPSHAPRARQQPALASNPWPIVMGPI